MIVISENKTQPTNVADKRNVSLLILLLLFDSGFDISISYWNPDVFVLDSAELKGPAMPLHQLYTDSNCPTCTQQFLFELSFALPRPVLVCNINMWETRDPVRRCDICM